MGAKVLLLHTQSESEIQYVIDVSGFSTLEHVRTHEEFPA